MPLFAPGQDAGRDSPRKVDEAFGLRTTAAAAERWTTHRRLGRLVSAVERLRSARSGRRLEFTAVCRRSDVS